MSGSYRQCVECGKRALRFATRCPGCGIDLPNPAPFEAEAGPELNGFFSLKIVMGVAAVGGVMVSLVRGPATPAPLRAETAIAPPIVAQKWTVGEALPAVEASYTVTTRADTVASVDSVTVSAATVALPPVIVAPTAATAKLSLVAKAWTNVHSRRSAGASLEAVLTPGDTVTADSLANGWYRVALYDEVLGYAKETMLTKP